MDLTTIAAPWTVTTATAADAAQFPYCVRDENGWSVAYVTGTTDNAKGKAALIAAAPAMLAALREILRYLPRADSTLGQYETARALVAMIEGAR